MTDIGRTIEIRRHHFNNSNKSDKPYVSHCFKMVWVRQGAAEWNIAGDLRSVGRNQIVLLNNEEERRFVRIDSHEHLELLAVELEPRFLYDIGQMPLFTRMVDGHVHRHVQAESSLVRLLEQVDREDRERDGYSQVVIAACVAQLLVGIARIIGFPAEIRPGIHPLMKSVLVHIDEHFARRISLNELAAIAHMSPTAFSKAFTKLNGIGPAQYIKRKRIGQAIRLLEDTDRTVIDIAMDCGFSNISNFYKAFHSLTGHAPGEYRTRQGPNGRLDAEGETVDSGKRMTEAGTGVGSKPGLPLPRPSIE